MTGIIEQNAFKSLDIINRALALQKQTKQTLPSVKVTQAIRQKFPAEDEDLTLVDFYDDLAGAASGIIKGYNQSTDAMNKAASGGQFLGLAAVVVAGVIAYKVLK
jgi:hypothetical protein